MSSLSASGGDHAGAGAPLGAPAGARAPLYSPRPSTSGAPRRVHHPPGPPPAPAPARPADPARSAGRRGDRDGRGDRRGRAGGARLRDRAGPAGQAGRESGGGMAELNIAVLEKAGALGEHSLSGAVVNPRAFHELFPELNPSDFPFRQPVARRGGLLPDRRPRPADPDAAHDAQRRLLHRVALRDRPLAGRARGGSWASTSSPAFRWTRCWWRATRCAECAPRPPASTATGSPPATTPSPPTSPRR